MKKCIADIYNQIVENRKRRNFPIFQYKELERLCDCYGGKKAYVHTTRCPLGQELDRQEQMNIAIDRKEKREVVIEKSIKKIRKFIYSLISDKNL